MKASRIVLILLCLMYGITYIDRVNVSTAAGAFGPELGLSQLQIGLVFSAFAWAYIVLQVGGGWISDRFGARRTLTVCAVIWSGATLATGLAHSFVMLLVVRALLGLGEGATFPTATRAMTSWTSPDRRGWAQGITHASARLGNAAAPLLVAYLMISVGWRGSFVVLGFVSLAWTLIWALYFRDDPTTHPAITPAELDRLPRHVGSVDRVPTPWARLTRRMMPVTITYFCYGWTLWLFLSWIPLYFKHSFDLDLKQAAGFASAVFFAGVLGDALGGLMTDWLKRRTGSLRIARRNMVVGFLFCAFAAMLPLIWVHDLTVSAVCLSAGFFFAEMTIGPMWAIPMDIAPRFSGSAAGLMNTGSALAAAISPVVAGFVIDLTGNWELIFIASLVLLLVGCGTAFAMHPEDPLQDDAPVLPLRAAVT